MAALSAIRKFGKPCLRQVCLPVEPGSPQTRSLLNGLWAIIEDGDGVGLAAPQIGQQVRVMVVRNPELPAGKQRLDVVNPELQASFGPDDSFEEGCLSFPGLYLMIHRPVGIRLKYYDADGKVQHLEDEGLVARIIQHELDHLDGRLFIDYLPVWRRWALGLRLLGIRLGVYLR